MTLATAQAAWWLQTQAGGPSPQTGKVDSAATWYYSHMSHPAGHRRQCSHEDRQLAGYAPSFLLRAADPVALALNHMAFTNARSLQLLHIPHLDPSGQCSAPMPSSMPSRTIPLYTAPLVKLSFVRCVPGALATGGSDAASSAGQRA